jgi:hypothetical protein
MQLLSALDQMADALWVAILASAALVACGIALHAAIRLGTRLYAGGPGQPGFSNRLRKLKQAVLPLP